MKHIKQLLAIFTIITAACSAYAVQIKLDQKVSYRERTCNQYNGEYFKHKEKDMARAKEFTCTITNTTPISVIAIMVVNSGGTPNITSKVLEITFSTPGVIKTSGEGTSTDIKSTWEGQKTSMHGKTGNSKVEAVVYVFNAKTKKFLGFATTSNNWSQYVSKFLVNDIKKELSNN